MFTCHKSNNLTLHIVRNTSRFPVCSPYQMQSQHACSTFQPGIETLSAQRPCFFSPDLAHDAIVRTLMTVRLPNQITGLHDTASRISQLGRRGGFNGSYIFAAFPKSCAYHLHFPFREYEFQKLSERDSTSSIYNIL